MAASVIDINMSVKKVSITIIPSIVVLLNGVDHPLRAKEERFDIKPEGASEFFEALSKLIALHRLEAPPWRGD